MQKMSVKMVTQEIITTKNQKQYNHRVRYPGIVLQTSLKTVTWRLQGSDHLDYSLFKEEMWTDKMKGTAVPVPGPAQCWWLWNWHYTCMHSEPPVWGKVIG
jgi:hypothetical protein